MAFSASTMAATIVANLEAIVPTTPTNHAKMIQYWTVVCQGIIDHVKADMKVTSQGADPQGGTVTSNSTTIV